MTTHSKQQSYIDTLNELLKGELMAMKIYKETQALQGDEHVRALCSSLPRITKNMPGS